MESREKTLLCIKCNDSEFFKNDYICDDCSESKCNFHKSLYNGIFNLYTKCD